MVLAHRREDLKSSPEDKKLSYLPILLQLRDRPCVVVGGGIAATKKVEALLSADARLTVISPQVTEVIARLAAAGHLQLVSRPYVRGDLSLRGHGSLRCR